MAAFYTASAQTSVFVIRDKRGEAIAASSSEIETLVEGHALRGDALRFFRLNAFGPTIRDYYGLDLKVESTTGPLWVTVAQSGETDALLHGVSRPFPRRVQCPP